MSLEIQKKILRQEIQKGIDDIRAGRSTTLESAEDYEQMAEKIIKRGRAKLAGK